MDAMRLLGGLLGNNALGSSMGGQVLNTLSRSLGGGGRRTSSTASLLGGLAVAAVQHYMRSSSAGRAGGASRSGGGWPGGGGMPDLAGLMGASPPPSPEPARANEQALLLAEAMIAAARADGHVDQEEQQRILQHLGELDAEERDFIREVMARPVDVDDLVRRTPAELRGSVYGVSVAAIRVDTMEEARYLRELAARLGLDHQTVAQIHGELGVPPPVPG